MICVNGKAPAKINIHLYVGGTRDDGYHELNSIFQRISLSDDISIAYVPLQDELTIERRTLTLSLRSDYGVRYESDLIHLSALAFFRSVSAQGSISITCHKRIPLNSGLGGGSSDAATTLLLLNELFGYPLSLQDLLALGAGIGSDIPFFLYPEASAAVVTGRGESVQPITGGPSGYVVLATTGHRKVSTALAFKKLDDLRSGSPIPEDPYALGSERPFRDLPLSSWDFINSFEAVLEHEDPDYRSLAEAMRRTEPDFFCLSGSGPWMFGLYSCEERASAAVERLSGCGYPTLSAEMI